MAKQLLLASAFMMATLCAFAQNNTTDEGVEINGIVWATRNVDAPGTFADNPEDAGMFFQWNRKKAWNVTDEEIEGWNITAPEVIEWETANDPCPAGWRIPNYTELRTLTNTTSTWATNWNGTGVNGRVFGLAPHQIFLPAVGNRTTTGTLNAPHTLGVYWSSEPFSSPALAWIFMFVADDQDNSVWMSNTLFYRAGGFSIRCVKINPQTSINPPPTETNRTIVAFYNVLGQRLGQAPQRGIYIVVFDNGTAERRMR